MQLENINTAIVLKCVKAGYGVLSSVLPAYYLVGGKLYGSAHG
jgi:hypothetical protein